jgi:methanogenic corrinoid protein MtbC1
MVILSKSLITEKLTIQTIIVENITIVNGGTITYQTTNANNEIVNNTFNTSYWSQIGTDIYYNDGFVGIGTTTPQYALDVVGDIQSSANIYAADYYSLSDIRYKKDIVSLPTSGASLDFINRLNPVTFKYIENEKEHIGFVAQEIQKVQEETGWKVPSLVSDADPERLFVSQQNLIPVLVKAVQEMSQTIKEMEKKMETLKEELNILKGTK